MKAQSPVGIAGNQVYVIAALVRLVGLIVLIDFGAAVVAGLSSVNGEVDVFGERQVFELTLPGVNIEIMQMDEYVNIMLVPRALRTYVMVMWLFICIIAVIAPLPFARLIMPRFQGAEDDSKDAK